jgi:Tol biopolymer transport system component
MKVAKLILPSAIMVFLSGCGSARLIIVSNRDNHHQIYKISEDGSFQKNLSASEYADQFPDISPDGEEIVFSSVRSDISAFYGTAENLFTMRIWGSGGHPGLIDFSHQITRGSNRKVMPRWSPARDRIAYAEYVAPDRAVICSISPYGGIPKQLTFPSSTQSDNGGHDFFALGSKLVFSRHDNASGNYDLYWKQAQASDSSLTRLTSTPEVNETLPVISHNGQMLAFRAYTKVVLLTGTFTTDTIQVMETRTWAPLHSFRLDNQVRNGTVAAVEFSSDDKFLYVAAEAMTEVSPPSSRYEIYKVSLDGTTTERLTWNSAEDTWPSAIPGRWVRMSPNPPDLKQGDLVTLNIEAGDRDHIARVDYTVNGRSGSVTTVPNQILFDTCKASGSYYTDLAVWCDANYKDGEHFPFSASFDLTTGRVTREDSDRTYAFYCAQDPDQDFEDRLISRANAFREEFDSYTESQYYYAMPWVFTNGAIDGANSVDLALAIGHGWPHLFVTGNGDVDFSTTAFGMFAPCNRVGDLKYLALISCFTLSLDDIGGNPFWYYWVHRSDTRLHNRPFTGLHMVLGFTTLVHFSYSVLSDSGRDFLNRFAVDLDDGMAVREAWFDAANEELDFADGHNRTAVLYQADYENDAVDSNRDHYIFGNPRYTFWVEYME